LKATKTKRKPKRNHTSPSDRPKLAHYQDRARTIIDGRLAEIGQTWHWLAGRLAEQGICSPAVVMQWKRGRNKGVGCGVWLAALDALAEGSAA